MTIEISSLPLSNSPEAFSFLSFGRQVKSFNPPNFTQEEFATIENTLYKHGLLLFRNINLSPEKQYALNRAFDPSWDNFGYGNNEIDKNKKSILHPDLKTIPRVPQVQLIGNGTVYNHERITEATLKHLSHTRLAYLPRTKLMEWHVSPAGISMLPSTTDAPPKSSPYTLSMYPKGPKQTRRYDDGTGDELSVPLGTTAFVSGRTMFEILPPELKSLAVRSKVKYAPLPYAWMALAHAMSKGLGLESEGLEIPYDKLPSWEEAKRMALPVLWKHPVTGELHFQVHPCGVAELLVDPISGVGRRKARYTLMARISRV